MKTSALRSIPELQRQQEACIRDATRRLNNEGRRNSQGLGLRLADLDLMSWSQDWPSDGCGFSGGAPHPTTALTMAIGYEESLLVYHDGRYAYRAERDALREELAARQLPGQLDAEMIGRDTELTAPELAERLIDGLGLSLANYALGISEVNYLRGVAADAVHPQPRELERMRSTYDALSELLHGREHDAVSEWLTAVNPDLMDRSPLQHLQAGAYQEVHEAALKHLTRPAPQDVGALSEVLSAEPLAEPGLLNTVVDGDLLLRRQFHVLPRREQERSPGDKG